MKGDTLGKGGKKDVADFVAAETRRHLDPPFTPCKRTRETKVESGALPTTEEKWTAAENALNRG